MLLRASAIIVIQNELFEAFFFQSFQVKNDFMHNNDQTWFSDTLSSAGPLWGR